MLKRILLVVLPFILFSFSNKEEQPAKADKWVTLFNGKDLSGWKPKINGYPLGENVANTFTVKDGILKIRYDEYKTFDNRFGILFFDKKFTNFRIRAEYRFIGETFTEGGPSWGYKDNGIVYRSQDPASIGLTQSYPVCLEYNTLGGNGKDERATGEICALGTIVEIKGKKTTQTCTPPEVKRTLHGEQWVTLEIDVRDNKVSHWVNGEKVLEFENPKYDPNNDFVKALGKGGDELIRSGYIGLQSNSHPVDYRKIEIMEYK